MIIQQMELHNWISFFGDHVIDFSVGDGSNGNVILIHGETSKGKTSLTSALRWVISGDIRIEKKIGGTISKLPRKLMMFNMPKWKGSLLNWEAYHNGNFKTEISVKFSQGDQNFFLQRSLYASNPTMYSELNQEVEKSLRLENLSSGEIFFDEKAQKIVNEFIPERLLKFFVVEGDFIQEYQETLFSSEKNIDMTDSVKDAIGVEALTRLSQVLKTDFTQVETKLGKIIDEANRDKEKLDQIEFLKKKIKELKEEVEVKLAEIEQLKISLERVINVLSSMEDSRQIIEEIRKLEGELEGSHRLLETTSNTISNSMNKVWKMALTPVVDDLSGKIEFLQIELEKLRDQRALCRLELRSVNEQNEHDEHCPTCKQKWDRGHIGNTEAVDIEELESNLSDLQMRIDNLRSKLSNLEKLRMYQQPEREVLNLKNDYLNLRELLAEIRLRKIGLKN